MHVCVRLTCHAPHPDPAREGETCGRILADSFPGTAEFIRTEDSPPQSALGYVVLRCSRAACRAWNVFRYLARDRSAA